MQVAFAGRYLDALFVHASGLFELPKLLECLTSMVVRSCIAIIAIEERAKLDYGLRPVTLVGIFHREAISRKRVARVTVDHLLQNF